MKSTERFIALLEERELVSPHTAKSLLAQVAKSRKTISAESIAKRLVKHGRLTSTQAKRLLAALEETPSGPAAESKPKAKPGPKAEDELGFAPIDGESAKSKRAAKRREEKPAPTPQLEQPSKPAAAAPAKSAGRESLLDQEMPAPTGGGPLDGLMSDAAMTASAVGSPLDSSPSAGRGFWRFFRRKPKIKTGEEQWGSSLMLLGGGGLLLLVILGGVLIWSLSRSSGDEMLRLADDDYRNGSYSQAINKYDKYLEKFPNHAGASVARVRIGLAQLRQATSSGSNWPAALKTAQEVLTKIAPEKDFKEAHGELASMLPAIAEGVAADARKKTSQPLVDQARLALKMARNPGYVPKSLRQESKLADVEASLAITVREIARGNELEKTIATMRKAAKESKTQDAYAACSALLRQYPRLVFDAKLKQALLEVSRAQQALVKMVSAPKPAESDRPKSAPAGSVTPAQCDTKNKVPDTEGRIALAAVDGAVYGLDAADGKVLWRRFVGFETNPRAPSFPPSLLGSEPGSDALVVDAARNELLRLEALSGNVRWRQSLGETFDAHPVVAGGKILVAARSGKLFTIDAASGESPGYVQFPQELAVAPAVDAQRSLIYQAAVHSNLFVLSLDDGACRDVIYLGHGSGSVNTAPVVVDDFLLLAVNDGAHDCVLKLFAVQPNTSGKPEPWLKPVQQIRLGGHVKTPPLVDGRRVLIATASGVVRVFEISATDVKMPLREIADTAIEGGGNLVRFPLLRRGRFWIADTRLTKYDVQAATGRLRSKGIADQEGAFLQPPVVVGEAVVCVQRRPGMPGAVVSAVSMLDPDQYWKTQLGYPLAAEPIVMAEAGKIVAVTAAGAVFRFDAGRHGATIVNKPIAAIDASLLRRPINTVVPLANGLLAISGGKGCDQIGVFDPNTPTPLMYWLKLRDELACAPVALGRGILVADRAGRISLLDPQSGDPLAEPFQPRLEPGEKIEWVAPAVVNDKEVVVANGQGKIYRLGIQDQPKPHLAMLAQTTVAKPIISPLAVAGNMVFGADEGNVLGSFDLSKLDRGKELSLDARCAWGPARIGDHVLTATEDNRLFCVNADGKQLWRTELKYGPLAGAPLRLGGNLILVARGGTICRLEAATGKELGKLDVGFPLATGAAPIGQGLIVGGFDGTIYEVRQP
ncbi:MAG: PQQ-binding-like beta-propeller repeat protein [Planctomycetes bacterium]|nr:PQQ-binding-like beta-propeller repeat protein [Planctomycetota bacterium]